MTTTNRTTVKWFQEKRGLDPETFAAFGVEVDGQTLRFPYPESRAVKMRSGFEGTERKFWWEPALGADQIEPFVVPDFERRKVMFIVEGETDTMALWQNLDVENRRGVLGLSGINTWKRRFVSDYLAEADIVYVILDQDDGYQARESVNKSWQKIRGDVGARARRVRLPQGPKDLCEFFMHYDTAAFVALLETAQEPKLHYPTLDLSGPPPPTSYLVDPFLARGEVAIVYGDAGVGKSTLALSLACALASGSKSWLDFKLDTSNPRVMVVDEENPHVYIHQILSAFGVAGKDAADNIHYIACGGVQLDEEPEKLYEDAMIVRPSLVIIDSLSRIHTRNENATEDMNAVFNTGIIPLARDLNAAVLLLHHIGAGENASNRPRGSTVIKAAGDTSFRLQPQKSKGGGTTGKLNLSPSKMRRVDPADVHRTFELIKHELGTYELVVHKAPGDSIY